MLVEEVENELRVDFPGSLNRLQAKFNVALFRERVYKFLKKTNNLNAKGTKGGRHTSK